MTRTTMLRIVAAVVVALATGCTSTPDAVFVDARVLTAPNVARAHVGGYATDATAAFAR
jgi:hypothetical protein